VWNINGNMVDGHSFGQVLVQKRWDCNMDYIEPVVHGSHEPMQDVELRSILEPTLGLTASFPHLERQVCVFRLCQALGWHA